MSKKNITRSARGVVLQEEMFPLDVALCKVSYCDADVMSADRDPKTGKVFCTLLIDLMLEPREDSRNSQE